MDDGIATVMVVGHNPTAQALGRLAGEEAATSARLPHLRPRRLPVTRPSWADVAMGTGLLVGLFTPPF